MAVSSINTECKRYGCIKNLLACYANCRYNTRCEELKAEVTDKTEQATKDINVYLEERGRNPITIQFMKRGLKFTDLKKTEIRPGRKKPVSVSSAKLIPTSAANKAAKPITSVEASKKLLDERGKPKPELRPKRKVSRRKKVKGIKASVTSVNQRPAKLADARSDSYQGKTRAPQSNARLAKRRPPSNSQRIKTIAEPAEPSMMVKKDLKKGRIDMPRKVNRPAKTISAGQTHESDPTTHEIASENNPRSKPSARQKRRNTSTGKPGSNGKLYIILDGKQASLVNERELMAHLLNNHSGGVRYFEAREVEARVQIVLKP